MNAARRLNEATVNASKTACPPRRSCVASAARRRGQACTDARPTTIAFGAALPTSALRADVDNARRFSVIVDD